MTDAGYHPTEYFEKVLKSLEDPRRPGHRLEWTWVVDFYHACEYLGELSAGVVRRSTGDSCLVQAHEALAEARVECRVSHSPFGGEVSLRARCSRRPRRRLMTSIQLSQHAQGVDGLP